MSDGRRDGVREGEGREREERGGEGGREGERKRDTHTGLERVM